MRVEAVSAVGGQEVSVSVEHCSYPHSQQIQTSRHSQHYSPSRPPQTHVLPSAPGGVAALAARATPAYSSYPLRKSTVGLRWRVETNGLFLEGVVAVLTRAGARSSSVNAEGGEAGLGGPASRAQ